MDANRRGPIGVRVVEEEGKTGSEEKGRTGGMEKKGTRSR